MFLTRPATDFRDQTQVSIPMVARLGRRIPTLEQKSVSLHSRRLPPHRGSEQHLAPLPLNWARWQGVWTSSGLFPKRGLSSHFTTSTAGAGRSSRKTMTRFGIRPFLMWTGEARALRLFRFASLLCFVNLFMSSPLKRLEASCGVALVR